jgi:hypothetical protein
MKFFATATYLLMVAAVFGSGYAIDDSNERVASGSGTTYLSATSVTADCSQQPEREFRNPNLRSRRIFSAVRGSGEQANCAEEGR